MKFFKNSLILGLCFTLIAGLLAGCNKGSLKADKTIEEDQIFSGFHMMENSGGGLSTALPENIREESITFGEDAFLLSGTLTTPTLGEDFPCVILVNGFGPQDRNETIGPNAPFRDIAWGLALQGIASIRYDKRTQTYGERMGTDITPKEETIDDAAYALDYARGLDQINGNNIYILGYDLGGYLMPKIVEVTPDAAGYIILGGSTSPLEDLMLRQYEYLAGLDNTITNDEAITMSSAKAAWDTIKQLTSESAEMDAQLLGLPRKYWFYLKDYNPTEAMKAVESRVLILQGEGDYQVGMAEFDQWKEALSDKDNITLKTYSGLNHLFMMGNGSKSPEDYQIPGKVSEEVINDLADFVQGNFIEV